MKKIKITTFTLLIAILTSCTFLQESQETTLPNDNNKKEEKVAKIIETEGIVATKEISLFEKGTHVLMDEEGNILYILESKTENISKYEKKEVKIKGELKEESNENGESLLTIITIESKEKPEELKPKTYELTQNGISITLPGDWFSEEKDNTWFFYPENTDTVISIESFLVKSELGKKAQDAMKTATDISVAGKKAFRVVEGNKTDIFVVNNSQEILLFQFTPQNNETEEKLIFLEMLTNVKWLEKDKKETDEKSVQNEKCGGVEAKLCPVGFRCELESDDEESEGLCVSIDEEVKIIIDEKDEIEIPEEKKEENIVCTMDAKMCPDGSYVGRDPNDNCNFFDCPSVDEVDEVKVELESEKNEDEILDEEDADNREIKYPANQYYDIENKHFQFKTNVPKNYYWRHFGPSSGAISLTGFSDIEMENADDIVINLAIIKGGIENKTENEEEEIFTILIPRDENTQFKLSGNILYKDVLQDIANSISILEEDVQE